MRIQVDPTTGVMVTGTLPNPKTLVSGWCQQFSTHSVGDLGFGADGQLYVSGGDGAGYDTVDFGQLPAPGQAPCPDETGDGGGALRAQDASTPADPTGLNGAVLRVDPSTGAASTGNPFSVGDANQRRIVGYGLRNPYRFAFRPGTSDLWLGDVGWGRWEEINRITPTGTPPNEVMQPARNFGWPCYEGDWQDSNPNQPYSGVCHVPYADVTAPFFSYYHTKVEGQCFPTQFRQDYNEPATPFAGSAITGMAFYAGGGYPASYNGGLFFADYARGCLWFMGTTNGIPDPAKIVQFASWDPGSDDPYLPADIGVVGLERGADGDIFIVDIANGVIRRLLHGVVDARASADVTSGPTNLAVLLDASASFSNTPGATIANYEWDLDGDGVFETPGGALPTLSHTFTDEGVTKVRVRATDSNGKTGVSDPVRIEVGLRPGVTIDSPVADGPRWAVGDPIAFSGTADDGAGHPLPPTSLTWDLVIRHCTNSGDCHSHFAGGSLDGLDGGRHGLSGSFIAPDDSYPSHLELSLTAKNSNGLTTTVTRRLDPATVSIALASDPAGRTLTGNDKTAAAPFICTVIKGSQTTISAVPSETADGRIFTFDSWSNGGPASQTFIATADQSLTARYTVTAPGGTKTPAKEPVKKPIRFGGTLTVSRKGVLGLRVHCPGPRPCRASLRLDTQAAASAAATRRLARAVAKRIAAGRTAVVRVRLQPAARRLLATRRTLKAVATVTVTPAGRRGRDDAHQVHAARGEALSVSRSRARPRPGRDDAGTARLRCAAGGTSASCGTPGGLGGAAARAAHARPPSGVLGVEQAPVAGGLGRRVGHSIGIDRGVAQEIGQVEQREPVHDRRLPVEQADAAVGGDREVPRRAVSVQQRRRNGGPAARAAAAPHRGCRRARGAAPATAAPRGRCARASRRTAPRHEPTVALGHRGRAARRRVRAPALALLLWAAMCRHSGRPATTDSATSGLSPHTPDASTRGTPSTAAGPRCSRIRRSFSSVTRERATRASFTAARGEDLAGGERQHHHLVEDRVAAGQQQQLAGRLLASDRPARVRASRRAGSSSGGLPPGLARRGDQREQPQAPGRAREAPARACSR